MFGQTGEGLRKESGLPRLPDGTCIFRYICSSAIVNLHPVLFPSSISLRHFTHCKSFSSPIGCSFVALQFHDIFDLFSNWYFIGSPDCSQGSYIHSVPFTILIAFKPLLSKRCSTHTHDYVFKQIHAQKSTQFLQDLIHSI